MTKQAFVTMTAKSDPRRWWGLTVVLVGAFMAILDSFIANVAAPSIHQALHASVGQIDLIIGGYVLVYGLVLITGGRLGDLYGHKRLFLVGVGIFTAASGACGLAPTPLLLIIARVAQAVGAGLLYPQVLATMQTDFDGKERARALGLFGTTIGVASIAGQLIGGLLISANVAGLSWRPVFLVNVLIGVLAIGAAVWLMRESRAEHPERLDLPGAGLLVSGLLLLIYPLIQGREDGWPLWMLLAMAASIPILVIFVWYERSRAQHSPLIDLGLFRQRTFSGALGIALAFFAGNAGLFILLAFYLQQGLGFSALRAGLTFTPLAVTFAAASLLAPRMLPKLGRHVLTIGYAINVFGTLALIVVVLLAGATPSAFALLVPLAVIGFGEGLGVSPLIGIALEGIPDHQAGEASGVVETFIQIGMSFGVAIITLIFYTLLGGDGAASRANHAAFSLAFRYTLTANLALALFALALIPLIQPGHLNSGSKL